MADNNYTVSLWVNPRAYENDGKNHPLLKGNVVVEGVVYDVALWLPKTNGDSGLAELARDAKGLLADYCQALGGAISEGLSRTGGKPPLSGKISLRKSGDETASPPRRKYGGDETAF